MRFTLLLSAAAGLLLIGVGHPAVASSIRSDGGDHGHGIGMKDHHHGDQPVSFYDNREGGWTFGHSADGDRDGGSSGSWWKDEDHHGWTPHDSGYGDDEHGHGDCKPVPEPGTFALMMLGLVGVTVRRR